MALIMAETFLQGFAKILEIPFFPEQTNLKYY